MHAQNRTFMYAAANKPDLVPAAADIMKHVNTIQMEELSDAQILAARKRRSKER